MARYQMHLVLSFWDEQVRLLALVFSSWRGIEGRADVNKCWVIIIILLDLVTEYLLSDGTWEITLVYHIMGTSMIFSLIASQRLCLPDVSPAVRDGFPRSKSRRLSNLMR